MVDPPRAWGVAGGRDVQKIWGEATGARIRPRAPVSL